MTCLSTMYLNLICQLHEIILKVLAIFMNIPRSKGDSYIHMDIPRGKCYSYINMIILRDNGYSYKYDHIMSCI